MALDIKDLHRKADGGSCLAQSVLGIEYLDRINVEANYQEAFRWLSAAAKQGAARAVVNLARMYADGLGVPRDMDEAVRLYKTVSKVEFLAPIALGRIYSREERHIDRAEALKWYSEAIEWQDRVGDGPEIQEAKAFVAGKAK